MKNLFFSVLSFALLCAVASSPSFAVQVEKENASQDVTKKSTLDKKIRFSFSEQDWDVLIPWFAEQAEFSLQPVAVYPEGTFTLNDDSDYTVLEALDQINHALLIRPEPYTLIRNRNMLVLWKTQDTNFPNDLIETVKVEDLDKRGKYETISCIFDVGELNAEDMYEQLRPMISDIHLDFFAVFPAANQLHIRETGGQLRDIRDLLKASQNRRLGKEIEIMPYRLKHQDAESFLLLARPLLGIPEEKFAREDQDLALSVDPFGDRMFIRGTTKMLDEFKKIALLVDAVDVDDTGDVVLAEPYLKTYPVFTDAKLALNILDTMFAGEDIVMDQDEVTGAISVLARADVHKKVEEYLDAISKVKSDDFAIITLTNRDPAEVIVILQNMFRQTTEEVSTGPVLMAQSELNQIMVRGTPQEVATVQRIVQSLDDNANAPSLGPRTGHRMIDMSANEQDEIMPLLEDLLLGEGRTNSLNIIMPEERREIRSRLNRTPNKSPDTTLQDTTAPESIRNKGSRYQSIKNNVYVLAASMRWNVGLTSLVTYPQDQVGSTSDEVASQNKNQDYRPAEQQPSKPGAPIEVRFTKYGIVLDSKDFDALDDLESAIYRRLDTESTVQGPQFFPLNYRSADEMLDFLQTYYGIDDGGGGGGAGGMMQGMMNNMMGGGAGGLLDGLLGGSEGSGGDGILEGDVQFGVDMPFNMVYVRGGTDNDIEGISELIETLDQPEPPHNPELIGDFYTIDVIHRDPTELKEIIEIDMGDLLDTGEKSKGGGQNQEAAQMMKMMQSLSGGGKRGGGGSTDYEKSKPKGKLGVDPTTKKLLVTGPRFIYEQVLKRVQLLDQADLSTPPIHEMMKDVGNIPAQIQTLRAMFGDKIEVIDMSTGESMSGTAAGSTAGQSSSANSGAAEKAQRAQMEAARNAFMSNALRSQQGNRGGAGGARGGGRTTGGRQGGGGGRGGGRGGR